MPLRKHICTLSAVRINIQLFSLLQGAVTGRGDLMDPIQVCSLNIILRLRDGMHFQNLSSEGNLQRKQIVYSFSSLYTDRQQTRRERKGYLVDLRSPKIGVLDPTSFSGFLLPPNCPASGKHKQNWHEYPLWPSNVASVSSRRPKPQTSWIHPLPQVSKSSFISFYESQSEFRKEK